PCSTAVPDPAAEQCQSSVSPVPGTGTWPGTTGGRYPESRDRHARELPLYPAPARIRGSGNARVAPPTTVRSSRGDSVPRRAGGPNVTDPKADTFAAVKPTDVDNFAADIAASATLDELEEKRVRYLGRKSELKL